MAIKRTNLAASHQTFEGILSLPENDAALFNDMIAKWTARRTGSLRHQAKSVAHDIAVVQNMLIHVGAAPWYWTEDDFDSWNDHIGIERGLAQSSQRKYQSAIRSFFEYITENVKFKNLVRQNYGIDLKQICHSENCIPHINETEKTKERTALTHEQIVTLFDAIDLNIKEAVKFHAKDVRPLQRDKAFFYLLYIGGLRISEALDLNVTSFEPNPNFPEFGLYGFIKAWGKGSKGSGKKFRTIPVTHPQLPQMLEWYVQNVRPYFMVNADANEVALFLSERGTRLAISTAEARFQHVIDLAKLNGLGFTPHCLRHSSVSHEAMRFSTEMVRRKHGHVYAATTQGYMHIPDEMVNDEINRVIGSQLDKIISKPPKGEIK
jgi:site-specific recombinase XerD